jgi:hypothetical protein
LWGLLHGVYLTINHAWRHFGPKLWKTKESYTRFMKPAGFVLTFLSVAVAMVLFRAPTLASAAEILKGMIGLNGIMLPQQIFDRLAPLADALQPIIAITAGGALMDLVAVSIWVGALLFIALAMPNSLEMLSSYEPALGVKPPAGDRNLLLRLSAWKPTIPWALATSALAATAVMWVSRKSEFLYWQF